MLVQADPAIHLTYCLNVHPGDSWRENFRAIREHAVRVRERVAPRQRFGLGLRLSARAAETLRHGDELGRFRDYLAARDLYVFTVNGFPYGAFHGEVVKENVYAPDWRHAERRDYTIALADILAELLPEGLDGSISTVPVSYKPWIASEADLAAAVGMLADVAAHLHGLRERTGRDICLALEPEPDCTIENTDEAVAFFTGPLRQSGCPALEARHGLGGDAAEVLRRHVGLCFDTAHMAVEFEDLTDSLTRLAAADVRVAKVHLSAALRLAPASDALRRLGEFAEGVYLHQVKARSADGEIHSYPDLPQALAAADDRPWDEWRVHFHVPLFFERDTDVTSTAGLVTGRFAAALRAGAAAHVEIETYTFGVLPEFLRPADLDDGIAREYEWVLANVLPETR